MNCLIVAVWMTTSGGIGPRIATARARRPEDASPRDASWVEGVEEVVDLRDACRPEDTLRPCARPLPSSLANEERTLDRDPLADDADRAARDRAILVRGRARLHDFAGQ